MRYYDVAIAIKKTDFAILKERVQAIKDEKLAQLVGKLMESADTVHFKPHADGFMFISWYDIDWNEDFIQIKYIMDFLNEIKEYSFVKNATDDDSEQPVIINNAGYYLLGIDRSIYYGT